VTWADRQIHPDDLHATPHPFDTIDTSVFVGAEVTPPPDRDVGEATEGAP